MKALSVRQPWAELIACGRKTVELRSRRTLYRGPLLICAGGAWHVEGARLHGRIGERGVTVCVVDLADCRPVEGSDAKAICLPESGVVRLGGYAWVLRNAYRVEPTPMLGKLGVFPIRAT